MPKVLQNWHGRCEQRHGTMIADFCMAIVLGFPFSIIMSLLIVYGPKAF